MAEADFLGKGWKFPISLDDEGKIAMSEAEQSIRESIDVILRTVPGERLMRPEYGSDLQGLVFTENNTTTASQVQRMVEDALLEYEPRIEVKKVKVTNDSAEGNRLNIEINYIIGTHNKAENLVYPFYLEK